MTTCYDWLFVQYTRRWGCVRAIRFTNLQVGSILITYVTKFQDEVSLPRKADELMWTASGLMSSFLTFSDNELY